MQGAIVPAALPGEAEIADSITSSSNNSRLLRLYAVLVVALCIAAGVSSLSNGFALDDVPVIQNNAAVHDFDLRAIWTEPYWPRGEGLGLYRPLTTTLFAVQWALGDGSPSVFHATSLLLHGTVSLFVLLLLVALLPETRTSLHAAFAGAAIFATHPVHVEAVANVVGQAELVAAVAVLAACLLWVRRPLKPLSWSRSALLVALYLFGMAAKEHAIVLPALLIALDAARGRWGRPTPVSYVRRVLPVLSVLAVAAVLFLLARHAVLGSVMASNANPGLSFLHGDLRIWNALRAWPEYARLLVFPLDLSVDYSPGVIPVAEGVTTEVAVGMLLLAATIGLAAAITRRGLIGLAAAWFLIVILPVSNLLFPIGVVVAERTLYLPSFAVALIAALSLQHIATAATASGRSARIRYAMLVTGVLCAAFLARSLTRAPVWASSETVMRSLIKDHPESYRSQWTLGGIVLAAGDTARAVRHYHVTYRIYPDDPGFLLTYANLFLRAGDHETGLRHLQHARRLEPGNLPARAASAYIFNRSGQPDSALVLYTGLQGSLGGDVNGEIARALEQLGRYAEAADAWAAGAGAARNAAWLYHALAARAAARAGASSVAGVEIEAARRASESNSEGTELVTRVAEMIAADCYSAGSECGPDPLGGRDGS